MEPFERCRCADVSGGDYLTVIFLSCGVIGENVVSPKDGKSVFFATEVCFGLEGTQGSLTIGHTKVKRQVTPTEEMQQPLVFTWVHEPLNSTWTSLLSCSKTESEVKYLLANKSSLPRVNVVRSKDLKSFCSFKTSLLHFTIAVYLLDILGKRVTGFIPGHGSMISLQGSWRTTFNFLSHST